jgi:hypothetical protein
MAGRRRTGAAAWGGVPLEPSRGERLLLSNRPSAPRAEKILFDNHSARASRDWSHSRYGS